MYHVNYTENPKDDTNKKTAKIEITIKPKHGTELRSGIKVRKIKSELRQRQEMLIRNEFKILFTLQ